MIVLKDISKVYNKGKRNEFQALDNINLTIEDGEMIALTGESGAGKSSLLHIMACIDSYNDGSYYLNGKLIKYLNDKETARLRNEEIGLIMQDFALIEEYTIMENIMLPYYFRRNIDKKQLKTMIEKTLKQLNLNEISKKYVKELSGGQKQRIAIARAVVKGTKTILADEPTGALDSKNSVEIMNIFKSLNSKGKTIIIVTHDKKIAEQCDRTIEISDGKIIT